MSCYRIAEGEVNAARAVVEQAQAEMQRARANVEHRRLQRDRLEKLRQQNAVSEGGMEEAKHALDDATASADAALMKLRREGARLGFLVIFPSAFLSAAVATTLS